MAQGVHVPNMPGSKISPLPRDGRPHQGRPPEPTETTGTSHPVGPVTPAPTFIVHQAQQVAQAAPAKKKIPSERWDLQAS